MNRFIYSCLLTLALPLIVLRLLWRARKAPAYRLRWGERFARVTSWPQVSKDQKLIHLHAVSVGEVHAAEPLVRLILQNLPDHQLLVTTSTPTGSARVKALFCREVLHVYLPYDTPWYMRAFCRHFKPCLCVILETELWPNLINQAHKAGARLALVNARLSEKSARGYRRVTRLARQMLQQLDLVCAQSVDDGKRLVSLGVPEQRLAVVPSLKYDIRVPESQPRQARQVRSSLFGSRPVVIAASTREGEETKVLEAFSLLRQVIPDAALVLVPRHPERLREVRQQVEDSHLAVVSRTDLVECLAETGTPAVLLGDTMGELFFYYSLADVAFVGGSLVDTGCQNILEPAALGLPIITGPSLFNFKTVSDDLRAAGAQQVVSDPHELAAAWQRVLEDEPLRQVMGARAREEFGKKSGASRELLARLLMLAGGS